MLEGKLLAEMWPRVFFIFFNFNWRKVRCFSLLVRPQLVGSPHYHLPPSISRDSAPVPCIDSIIHSMQHPPLQRELSCAIPTLNYVFFFFNSVTDVISNVAKYNTSVKIYLSKSKITDFKNYLKITKYTKKLLNYSNVSKCNSLLYTSGYDVGTSTHTTWLFK